MSTELQPKGPAAILHEEISNVIRTQVAEPRAGGRAFFMADFKTELTAEIPLESGSRMVSISASKYPLLEVPTSHITYLVRDSLSGVDVEITVGRISSKSNGQTNNHTQNSFDQVRDILEEINKPTTVISSAINVLGHEIDSDIRIEVLPSSLRFSR